MNSIVLWAILYSSAGDPKDEAKVLINRGNQKFASGDHPGALEDFLAAYEVYPSPKILLNVAEAYRTMERAVEAVTYYERFLEEASDPGELASDVQGRIADLSSRIGRIAIVADPEISVLVDGSPQSGKVVVAPGLHRVVATREGFVDFTREIDVAAGSLETVPIELSPIADPTPPIDAPPAVVVAPPDPPITEQWWFWTAIGAGAVVIGSIAIGVAASTGGDGFVPMGELGRHRASDWETF